MTRVPRAKTKLKKAKPAEAVFMASSGTRTLAGGLCAILCVMFVFHQTQIDGLAPLWRGLSLALMLFFGVLAWYFLKRGSRRGPVMRVGPEGFGMALGFDGWIDVPWSDVEAFRYWEPTGIAMLVKRRQSRWVGILLKNKLPARNLTWDMRFEIWLNTFHNRPGLCLLHPFVQASILDVLQAFKDHAPKQTDDYRWMTR